MVNLAVICLLGYSVKHSCVMEALLSFLNLKQSVIVNDLIKSCRNYDQLTTKLHTLSRTSKTWHKTYVTVIFSPLSKRKIRNSVLQFIFIWLIRPISNFNSLFYLHLLYSAVHDLVSILWFYHYVLHCTNQSFCCKSLNKQLTYLFFSINKLQKKISSLFVRCTRRFSKHCRFAKRLLLFNLDFVYNMKVIYIRNVEDIVKNLLGYIAGTWTMSKPLAMKQKCGY